VTREVRIGLGIVAALGAFVFFLLVVGSLGGTRPEVDPLEVGEVLASPGAPAERYGDRELRIVGWYAELDGDCRGDTGGADESVAWLQRDCPLRVLLAEQPAADVTQAELERNGLRLAAPIGRPFPSRAEPGGANLRGQPLVFIGHFADPAAASCVPDRIARCESTFVVSDYDGFVR
jgi:hypothetical protein